MQNEGARKNGASRLLSAGRLDGSVSASSSPTSCYSGAKYIEHHVSKMDTLAGLAIMYGVEVADIKRMNGLATDGQMFAHRTLRIPWPGRHSPSTIHLNGAANYRDTPDSLQRPKLINPQHKISPAMISLQGYYGLKPPKGGPAAEETEMSVYKISSSLYFEDESPKTSPASGPEYPNKRRMSASLANGFPWENGEAVEIPVVAEAGDGSDEKLESEKSIRRRQKADTDPLLHTLDILMEDGGGLAGRIGKSLAPRLKLGTPVDIDLVRQNAVSAEDTPTGNGLAAVRKSTSTSNLQDSDSGSTRSSSKWTSKSDASTRPVFGGLPKPIVAWNKAALD
ncbi:uncharacterized protein LOC103716908 isoform X2 [Phoenix dactylifera]|uniref:Uncharacterized protein LOC103716908 isoform X2 n=1 Tax=Phoenix dactylifera TaxID=42345 RepID=A0A8B7CP22_PHODC|nr:uncharacterized protein LOC103716908 isoform X2 [Phoenix dactylifera]